MRVPDLRSTSRGFKVRPPRCQVQPQGSCLHVSLSPSSITGASGSGSGNVVGMA